MQLNVCPHSDGLQAGDKPLTSHVADNQALTCPSTAELGFQRRFLGRPCRASPTSHGEVSTVELLVARCAGLDVAKDEAVACGRTPYGFGGRPRQWGRSRPFPHAWGGWGGGWPARGSPGG